MFQSFRMATFTPELDSYERKDGTQAILIRITVDRKHKRVPVKATILAKYWNPEKREVRKSYPQAAQVNALIKSKIVELEQLHLKSHTNKKHTSAEFLQKAVVRKYSSDSFFNYMERRIQHLPSPHTRKAQSSILQKLKDYTGDRDLQFGDITSEFLAAYRNHLSKKLKNGSNTIHSNIQKLRTAYDEAVEDGLFSFDGAHPFNRTKITTTKSKRTKLKEEEIAALEAYQAKPGTALYHSINAFLFSYYMQGMRVGDLLELTWDLVKGNRLRYRASKTKKARSRLIISKAMAILDQYRVDGKESGYIFPFLDKYPRKNYTEEKWLAVLDSRNTFIRKKLGTAAKHLGLPKISMHVARHSFADIARKKTGNIYLVSDALDHGNVKITENYFSAAEAEENDEFVKSILGE